MANNAVSHYGTGSYLRNVAEPLIGSSTNSTEAQTLHLANAPAGGFAKSALPEWPSLSGVKVWVDVSRLDFFYLLSGVRIS
jgi:hypothetical protein